MNSTAIQFSIAVGVAEITLNGAVQLGLEAKLQQVAANRQDYRGGVAAFHAKRMPLFQGR